MLKLLAYIGKFIVGPLGVIFFVGAQSLNLITPGLGFVLIVVSIIGSFWQILHYGYIRERLILINRKYQMYTMTAFLITGSALGAIVGYIGWVTLPMNNEKPTPKQQAIHTLLMRISQFGLPVTVDPQTMITILPLHPEIQRWNSEFKNSGQKSISWPPGVKATDDPPPDFVYMCEITNPEDKTLLDISIPFSIQFHELEPIEVTVIRDKVKDETKITFPRPGPDHVILGTSGLASGNALFKDGALVKSFQRPMSIPSIPPNTTAKIYILNQSEKFIVKFRLPREGTAIVAGNTTRVPVVLVRPDTTVQDAVPWVGLAPTSYDWQKEKPIHKTKTKS